MFTVDYNVHFVFNFNLPHGCRELQAKAKRLARFKNELSETVEVSPPDIVDERLSVNRFQHNVEERKKRVGEQPTVSAGEFLNDTVSSDFEGMETSGGVIIGSCTDMCPGMCPESLEQALNRNT